MQFIKDRDETAGLGIKQGRENKVSVRVRNEKFVDGHLRAVSFLNAQNRSSTQELPNG